MVGRRTPPAGPGARAQPHHTWQELGELLPVSRQAAQQRFGDRASVRRKGPYRVAEVPLVFEHGPMRASVAFDHENRVAGLFLLPPGDG